MANITKQTFPVTGLSCAACAVSVESMLKSLPNVKDAIVSYATKEAIVTYDSNANVQTFKTAIQEIGYDLLLPTSVDIKEEIEEKEYKTIKQRAIYSLLFALPVMVLGMFYMHLPYSNYIQLILTIPILLLWGRHFYIRAWQQAKHGLANMDTLVAISTATAFLFSLFNTFFPQYWSSKGLEAHVYYEAATIIIAFVSLGKWMEERAKSNTSSALKKLVGLQAKEVIVYKDSVEVLTPIAAVQVGDSILVKPGEKIAVDGIVENGNSYIDESMISGEPTPVNKKEKDKVYAGTINGKSTLVYKAVKVGEQTLLSQIIKTVKQAQASKAPVQKLVDKISGIFVPIVIGIATLTFVIWLMLGNENAFTHALLAAVTVLVIACPCALGLATPTAIMVGVGKGAMHQILIKDAQSLELAHKIDTVVLDKTGTITEGKPAVLDEWKSENFTNADADAINAIEKLSEHPLAEALIKHLNLDSYVNVSNFMSKTGKGVSAEVGGLTYRIGNKGLMNENGIATSTVSNLNLWIGKAYTIIYVSRGNELIALYAVADKVKEGSKQAISELTNNGISIYMLTGDNADAANAIAKEVGITAVHAELLPSDKSAIIKQLQKENRVVAMVGDGINDSEALAIADVGIAMGKGSDIAMDVAEITITNSDLRVLPKAIKLSAKTIRVIKQNLFWAFVYNVIGIPLAAGILYPINGFLLTPMLASAAMALSSVSVVTNSLRLNSKL
ncbi:MAG: heavy metal translocating P-type ATPase [Bacteroidia bacterium]|nr:heavy metal translocating P-type ATPase [Bacteroidia bacterium]